jgi:hypothetical protein
VRAYAFAAVTSSSLRALVDQFDDRPEDGASRPEAISCSRAFRAAPGASRVVARRRRRAAAPSRASSKRRSRCRARTYSGRYSPPMLIGRRATRCSRSGTWAANAVGRARDAPDREHRPTHRQPAVAEDDTPIAWIRERQDPWRARDSDLDELGDAA